MAMNGRPRCANVVDGADIGVIQGGGGPRFAPETCDGARRGDPVGQHFERDERPRRVSSLLKHFSHSATAQWADDSVGAETSAGRKGQSRQVYRSARQHVIPDREQRATRLSSEVAGISLRTCCHRLSRKLRTQGPGTVQATCCARRAPARARSPDRRSPRSSAERCQKSCRILTVATRRSTCACTASAGFMCTAPHEPARLVGADRQQRQIDGAEAPPAMSPNSGGVGRVAGEVDLLRLLKLDPTYQTAR